MDMGDAKPGKDGIAIYIYISIYIRKYEAQPAGVFSVFSIGWKERKRYVKAKYEYIYIYIEACNNVWI
jgi:hypothetical protein